MESLKNSIKTTSSYGWIKGFEMNGNTNSKLGVTHLQHVDDMLIFCDAIESN